ncbi:tetratricopeptide repeat protein [Enterovirga rhinocerotis]|uniref:Tetratricopeptide repeat protein n=1 Tax=Enterovirga rhinocerotis TaxID=1339210 RepID=A0A4R7C5W1_9HYPH|nr:tetratricopeptide repeat protein [Enterovirga rhinocerotis]TDR93788.1 tetratricopeptide repeat protein [Enterovirga rhinocerotis]
MLVFSRREGGDLRRGAASSGLVRVLALAALSSCLWTATAEARRTQSPAQPSPPAPHAAADSLEGNYLSAYIAVAARDTVAAAHFYREALREDPNNPELLERAFISLLADGDFDSAARAAERLAVRDPNNGLAQLTLAVRAFRNRHFQTARNHLSRGTRGRAADVTATLLTAWSFAGSRDGRRALETTNALRAERGFAVFRDYHAGLMAELTGNRAEAERRYKAAYDVDKTTLRITDAYGRFLARSGRKEEALAVYRAYEASTARHPFVKQAIAALDAGKPLTPLIPTAQEGAAEVLYGLGSASTQQGDELASLIYLRLSQVLSPDNALALVTMADVFERMKQTDQAIATLRRIPESSPLKMSADVQIGLSLEQLGKGDEAVAQLDKVKLEHPEENDVLVALGNVLRSRKRYAEAAEIYGQVLDRMSETDPGRWPILYYRGTAYERAKDWDKAEIDLKAALALVPDTQPLGKSQVLNYLGYSWVDNGRNIEEAFKLLKRAVELNPRDGMIIDSLGWAYYRLGQFDDAVRELEKAAELKAGDPVINDHLGDAYWHVGRRLEARFQWQHAKDSNPEPEDLKKIEEKLQGGMPELPKPAEAGTNLNEQFKQGG